MNATTSGATAVNACVATAQMGGWLTHTNSSLRRSLTVYEDFLHEAQFNNPLARARLDHPRQRCQHLLLLALPPKTRKVVLVPRAAAAASSPRPCPRPFVPPAPQRDVSYSLALPAADAAAVPAYAHSNTARSSRSAYVSLLSRRECRGACCRQGSLRGSDVLAAIAAATCNRGVASDCNSCHGACPYISWQWSQSACPFES